MRSPLLPLLSVGVAAALVSAAVVLHARRPRSEPQQPAMWVADVRDWGPGRLGVGLKATGPLPGQKRPPCEPRVEREAVGACWWPHLEKPPCPPGFYEYEGMCLAPVALSRRPATSLGE